MKRYIRTKDGKIFDTIKDKEINTSNEFLNALRIGKIIKEADTIEELIEVGDLVFFNGNCFKQCSLVNELSLLTIRNSNLITELYIERGNYYFIVAYKENGEWRVI